MLINVSTTIESLHPSNRDHDDSLVQFLGFLNDHSVLTHSQAQFDALKNAVRNGSGDRATSLLKEIMLSVPKRISGTSPDDAHTIEDLHSSDASLVVIDPTLAEKLNVTFVIPKSPGHPEVVRAGYLYKSPTCEQVRQIANFLNPSQDREEVWTQRFLPLIAISDSIKIYDRYLIDKSGGAPVWNSGLDWFLSKFALRNGPAVNVEIFTLPPDTRITKIELENLLVSTLKKANGGIRQISINVCDGNSTFARGPRLKDQFHDRIITFVHNGRERAITLGTGMDTFKSQKCRASAIAYFPVVKNSAIGQSLSEIIRTISGAPSHSTIKAFRRVEPN